MIKAIFFDFNGVIIDDESIQMKAYQEVLRGHEIDLKEEWYMSALGMDDRTFVQAMFERAKKPLTNPVLETVLNAKVDLHREMIAELPLFPGVLTFLKACAREFSIGLVSMANKAEVG
jgi:phosphoglycolate phosphatase/beta-phosphoglucomutase